jgi:hypothetical protein
MNNELTNVQKSEPMQFIILYKAQTSRGHNYFKLLVEIAHGIWEEATYFGSTTPSAITSLSLSTNGYWVAEIQKHTSRDQNTGRFKGKRKTAVV